MTYEPVIGLEIHAELKTRTKMFCGSLNDSGETRPNVNICPVCIGHPGALPVINREAIKKVISVGLALHGEIPEFSQFDRKNYFYPDLPKGYQISQYKHPLVLGGWIDIEIAGGQQKKIRIRRVHLEEETGRLIHDAKTGATLVDFNRAGIPLMELVTEPDMRTAEEARRAAENLRIIFQYVGASNADMEKGEMRIEPNVSLRPSGSAELGVKVELKNINSFRFMERAIEFEISRQKELLDRGEKIIQETRGWDEAKGETVPQRVKEGSADYRYFPEPDLPPLKIERKLVEELRALIPELPQEKLRRFREEFGIDPDIAAIIVRDRTLAAFFEAAVSELAAWLGARGKPPADAEPARLAANYLTTDAMKILAGQGASIGEAKMTPENFAELITYLIEGKISSRAAKAILAEMMAGGKDPSVILEEKGLHQVSHPEMLAAAVEKAIAANPAAIKDYQAGKTSALQFLIGRVMKESGGANPEIVKKLLEEKLG